jgi:hypothetical protein
MILLCITVDVLPSRSSPFGSQSSLARDRSAWAFQRSSAGSESAGAARSDVDLHRPVHGVPRRPIGEHCDDIIFVRDITPTHPTENALRTTDARLGGFGLET